MRRPLPGSCSRSCSSSRWFNSVCSRAGCTMTSASGALWSVTSSRAIPRRRWLIALRKSVTYVLLFAGSIIMLLPFVWMLSTSLKTPNSVFVYPPEWIPNPVQWTNYADVVRVMPFLRYVFNRRGVEDIPQKRHDPHDVRVVRPLHRIRDPLRRINEHAVGRLQRRRQHPHERQEHDDRAGEQQHVGHRFAQRDQPSATRNRPAGGDAPQGARRASHSAPSATADGIEPP